jgi:hypothetical protein
MACSSQRVDSAKKHVMMGFLWQKNATKAEVIGSFGNNYKEVQDGIIYSIPGLESIQSGHFFEADKLVEQYIFLDEKSLEELKSQTPCNWSENNKLVAMGHTVYKVQRGECSRQGLTYKFLPGNNYYEIRWMKSIPKSE